MHFTQQKNEYGMLKIWFKNFAESQKSFLDFKIADTDESRGKQRSFCLFLQFSVNSQHLK